jgi:hypothetical protein
MATSLNAGESGLLAAVVWLAIGCSSQAADAPKASDPLPEARAREVIAMTIHEAGERPLGKHFITVKHGHQLEVDIGVVGKGYGVAYVTGTERESLGDSVPAYDVGSNSLRLIRDLKDRQKVILLLHDLAYLADEHRGTEREKTAIAAELKLQRDVRDFLSKARGEGWQ